MEGNARPGEGAPGAWLEVSVETSGEAVEAVSEMLMEYGAGGVVIDDPRLLARRAVEIGPDLVDEPDAAQNWRRYISGATGCEQSAAAETVLVRAYLPVEETAFDLAALAVRVAALAEAGLDPGPARATARTVHEEDWAHAWKQYYTVQRIGKRIVIVPSWLEYVARPDDIVITLDPGMAFGTGAHPTTRLCLEELEEQVRPGTRLLDVGTGSGILAIAAAKLGATVFALDIDARAAAIAAQNAAANEVGDAVRAAAGSLAAAPAGVRFDIIVANIVADTIVNILPDIKGKLAPGGCFIASGIVESRCAEVELAWRQAGLTIARTRRSDEWVCMAGGAL